MIHATRSEFILTKNLGEIRYLSIAIGPTYIIRATLPTNNHILIHCDLKGNILYEQSLPADLSVIEMLSERYLVYFYEDLNMIVCLDLKHKKQHFIPHAFNMVKYHTDMHVFKKTNYFCLVEIAREVDNSMILTYYHPESKVLVHTYETKPGDYNDDCELIAVNTRNKVCWYMEKGNYDLEFTTYDIEDNIQGKLTHYKFHNNVPIDVRITRSSKNKIASFSLTEMIELRRNIYLFACKHQNDQMVFLMNTEAEETIRLAGYKFEGALL